MMVESMSNAFVSFISEAMILTSSELILFSIAVFGYFMMHSFSALCTGETKNIKISDDSSVVTESECTSQEVLRRFERGDYRGVIAIWPAVMCSDCVPSSDALSHIIESMQKLGIEVHSIAEDVRRALKQNSGLCGDADCLCQLAEDLRNRGCASLLAALLAVFEELESVLGDQVLQTAARATACCHLAEGNTEAAESIMTRYSALRSLMTPSSTGCVPQELPSFTGQCGRDVQDHEDQRAGHSNAIVLQKTHCNPNNEAAHLLCSLTTDLVADVFAFTELRDVLNCAGLACRSFHNTIWRQPDFWVGLGGPVFIDSLCAAERPVSIVPMIRSFRHWVFGLDGEWSLNVEQLGSIGHPADALRSVLGYVQVLQPGDAELSDIWRLVRAAENSMQRADVKDNVLLGVASELVDACQKRQDIFGSVDIKDLHAALVAMEKRAEQDNRADERNHWFFSDEAESNEQGTQHAADDLLSLSFLAVMDNHEN